MNLKNLPDNRQGLCLFLTSAQHWCYARWQIPGLHQSLDRTKVSSKVGDATAEAATQVCFTFLEENWAP